MNGRVSEAGWARLSAIGVVLVLVGLVAAAVAGKPAPPPPRASFQVVPAIAQATPTAGPTLAPIPSETTGPARAKLPTTKARHNITGEDGIFGLPGWPWRADDTRTTVEPKYYIRIQLCNLCRRFTR